MTPRTTRNLFRAALTAALAVTALGAQLASADLQTLDADAHVELKPEDIPSVLGSRDFAVVAWITPASEQPPGAAERAIIGAPGTFQLGVDADGRAFAEVYRPAVDPLRVEGAASLSPDVPWLVGMSYRENDGSLTLFVGSAAQHPKGLEQRTETAPEFIGQDLGTPAGGMVVGASGDRVAFQGHYGVIALRSHALEQVDIDTIWDQKRRFAAYLADTTANGGRLNGPLGCAWMIGHSITTVPIDRGAGGEQRDRVALPGMDVGPQNFHVYNRLYFHSDEYNRMRVVNGVLSTSGFRYEILPDTAAGFLNRDVAWPTQDLGHATAVSPKARQLATDPQGLLRVVVSSNSRGVRADEGSGVDTGSYAYGFIDLLRERVAGVLLNPATPKGGRPGLGFDTLDGPPRTVGDVFEIPGGFIPSAWHDLTRAWTGSEVAVRPGPGTGVLITPSSAFGMSSGADPDSLLRVDQPMVVEAYLFRFPGAGSVAWSLLRESAQGAHEWTGPETTLDLNTSESQLVFDATASYTADPPLLTLQGDLCARFPVGHAVFIASGSALGSMSLVTAAACVEDQTIVALSHPFGRAPDPGAELRVGPVGYETVRVESPAVEADDPLVRRGLWFRALPDGHTVLFALSAWNPTVRGYVIGPAGWGGNGYRRQIDHAFLPLIPQWMSLTEADVWLQVPAQQGTDPEDMDEFSDLVRSGLPDAEIVWAGEAIHPGGSLISWNQYIESRASELGIVGINAAQDPRLGSAQEQYADAQRSDPWHITARGNRIHAEVWTDLLREHALASAPCSADITGDGTVNPADVGAFLSVYFRSLAEGSTAGDFNGDGAVNPADVGAYLSAYFSQLGQCPPG